MFSTTSYRRWAAARTTEAPVYASPFPRPARSRSLVGPALRLALFGLLLFVVIATNHREALSADPAEAGTLLASKRHSSEKPKKPKKSKQPKSTKPDKGSGEEKDDKDETIKGDDTGDDDGPAPSASPEPSASATAGGPRSAAIVPGSGLPEWTEGMNWTVKSVYRKLPIGRVGKDVKPEDLPLPGWTEPTFWTFHVKKVKRGSGVSQYLVQVRAKDGDKAAMASLFLARYPIGGGAEVLSLSKGKFYTMIAGQLRPTSRPYVPAGNPSFPVLADDSLIPYDMPVLPFLPRAPVGQKGGDLTRTFAVTEDNDGLKFARDVTQIEHQGKSMESFVGKEVAEYVKAKGWDGQELTLVELKRKFDGQDVKQVWSNKLPWFLYSESSTMRSWLLETGADEPGPAQSPAPSAQN